ncbi:thioesterase family protein [Thermodesulfobacteriota bacterium]
MELEVGLSGYEELVVTEKDLASFAGNIGVDVLSTHRLVLLMEMAARNAILGRIPEGKIPLGTRINIRHLAAAPPGALVRAEARLAAVAGRRLHFEVAAFDQVDKLAEGENELIMVSLERFKNRIREKSVVNTW